MRDDRLDADAVTYQPDPRGAATATQTWRRLVARILTEGRELRQEGRAHEPRSRGTREIVACQTRWPMSRPVVLCARRRMGRRFAAAEAAWIIGGSNMLDDVAHYAPHLRRFSDDGVRLSGAYGPPFVDQLVYVVSCLAADPASRQAVTTLWRPRPGPSRDIPCTISLQYMIREHVLHCVATMRSSDAWLGIPYDVVSFSVMAAVVATEARARGARIDALGDLVLTTGSGHLYAIDFDAARACADEATDPGEVTSLDLAEVTSARALGDHLWALARREPTGMRWLAELSEVAG